LRILDVSAALAGTRSGGEARVSKLVARDVMSSNVVHCRDIEEAEDAIRIMESNQIRRLPVLDEAQKLIGMVSLGDISHALPQDLAGEVAKAVSAHHP
jgi:CBS domain-containing protein